MSLNAKQTLEGSIGAKGTLAGNVSTKDTLEGVIALGKPLAKIEVSKIEGGHRITVTDPDGVQVLDVMDGLTVVPLAKISEAVLLADAWEGEGNLYSQVVDIAGVTENCQVDLTPSIEQLAVFYEKDLAFVTENASGVVTVYAIGQKPQNDYTIQVTITEVEYE